MNYIKTLQSTFQRLQKQKLERLQGGPSTNSLPFEPSVAVAATSRLAMLSTRETFMADQVSSMNNNNNNNNNNSINNAMRTSTTLSASASHLPVMIQTWTSSNVVLNICGNDAQFAVYASKRPGLFTTICCVLEKYKLEVLSAHISSDVDRSVYMIQAHVSYLCLHISLLFLYTSILIIIWFLLLLMYVFCPRLYFLNIFTSTSI